MTATSTRRDEFRRHRDAMLREFQAWLETTPTKADAAAEIFAASHWIREAAAKILKSNSRN